MQPAEAGACRPCASGGQSWWISAALAKLNGRRHWPWCGCWHVGCNVNNVVDFGQLESPRWGRPACDSQRASEEFKAGQIEEAHEDGGQVGGQIGVCLRESRCNGRWVSWRTPPLHKVKEVLQVWHTRQHAGGCKSLLLKAHCDHPRMRVIEQVLSEVRGGHEVR